VSLFRKRGGSLLPSPFAQWLYRAAASLLQLEAFTRRAIAAPPDAQFTRLRLDLRLRFVLGRVRHALAAAIDDAARNAPHMLVETHWSLERGPATGTIPSDCLGFTDDHAIILETITRAPALHAHEIAVHDDEWVLVRRRQTGVDAREPMRSAIVPAFAPPVVEQIIAYGREHGLNVRAAETDPGNWPQLLDDNPEAVLFLPSSAFGIRPGTARVDVIPLDPPLASTLIARTDGSDAAQQFVQRLRHALAQGESAPGPTPVLTERRLRYFNLAFELGSVSSAARAASVAQPALSQQLHKLEETLGVSLFNRSAHGLGRTSSGARFAISATLLERRLREMRLNGKAALLSEGGELSLGILPSVSHHGHLVNRITDAILALRSSHPRIRITVREAPNGLLQNWVLSGRVGLAIVETSLPQMPRLPLDASEDLAVIADPRHALLPPGPIRFDDLANLPLILPTDMYGLRQLLDTAARERNIELKLLHEMDALTLLIAMLSREPVATILPASALHMEILRGEFSAHPIIEPGISRRLYAIYSGDRSLTPVERELVGLLRSHLSPDGHGVMAKA
jgi:LysR family transcriptional regulator, nitrogen assimilation regulatory protein